MFNYHRCVSVWLCIKVVFHEVGKLNLFIQYFYILKYLLYCKIHDFWAQDEGSVVESSPCKHHDPIWVPGYGLLVYLHFNFLLMDWEDSGGWPEVLGTLHTRGRCGSIYFLLASDQISFNHCSACSIFVSPPYSNLICFTNANNNNNNFFIPDMYKNLSQYIWIYN